MLLSELGNSTDREAGLASSRGTFKEWSAVLAKAKAGFLLKSMTKDIRQNRSGFAALEALLLLAVLILILQLIPEARANLLWIIDFRNWPRTMWFVANIAVVMILLTVRFGPQLVEDFRERKTRLAAEYERKQKQQELKEQRESLDRLKQAQRRRIY